MKVSKDCVDLVKTFEGFRSEAYKCPAGIWTIGYGHTKNVKPKDVITERQALQLLQDELNEFADKVNKLLKIETSQAQFDALVSFAYNLGVASLQSSTLLKKHNTGDFLAAADEFLKWDKAKVNGKLTVLSGLSKRRRHESALYGRE
jgi:lysozyme